MKNKKEPGGSLRTKELTNWIMSCAQLAGILEVSGWPKPGNVHRTKDHPDTRYEHFLVGSVVLSSSVEASALKGVMVGRGRLTIQGISIGKHVKVAVSNIAHAHRGGNTHLGICLFFIPLAVAAGKTYVEAGSISDDRLRRNVEEVMRSTTPRDAVNVYEAIAMVSSPRELGKVSGDRSPDIYDKKAIRKILQDRVSLFDVMSDSSSYDTIARELVTGMGVSFEIGYRELVETLNRTGDVNTATVHTFLRILSMVPDTFIARKVGLTKASDVREAVEIGIGETQWISETARRILDLGGLTTEVGRKSLWEFDQKLQSLGKSYSPGTTADLTAASLFIALLCGLIF